MPSGLRELGYREGENIILEPCWTEGHQEQLASLVNELLGLNVAVLVTAATPASLAAKADPSGPTSGTIR